MKSLVAPEIEAYAEAHSFPESEVCKELREETYRCMELPQMVVGPLEGAFLKLMAQFLPNLRTIIALKREEAHYLGYTDSPYNALLDTYEPGWTVAHLKPLLTTLRRRLVTLLNRVRKVRKELGKVIIFSRVCPHLLGHGALAFEAVDKRRGELFGPGKIPPGFSEQRLCGRFPTGIPVLD